MWLSLVVPSLFVVHKYLGGYGVSVYAVVVAAVVAFAPALPERVSHRVVFRLMVATFVGIAIVFAAAYPLVNTATPGAGSDDDDTLDLGASALLAGRFPYAETTYLGNPLHHFAGAFLLAAPFRLLGASALQNLFWIPLFFAVVEAETADARRTLALAWLVLACSPAVMHDIVTGTGYASNGIYVALGLWWVVRSRGGDLAAIAWGVALASRANFLFAVPLAFAWLCRHTGMRTAVRATALTLAAVAALTVPFYLYDPRRFTPLEAADRLFRFDSLVPHAGVTIVGAMAVASIALASTRMDAVDLFRNCAIVQALPVVAGIALATVQARQPDFLYARYAAFAAWFMLMGEALAWSAEQREDGLGDAARGGAVAAGELERDVLARREG